MQANQEIQKNSLKASSTCEAGVFIETDHRKQKNGQIYPHGKLTVFA